MTQSSIESVPKELNLESPTMKKRKMDSQNLLGNEGDKKKKKRLCLQSSEVVADSPDSYEELFQFSKHPEGRVKVRLEYPAKTAVESFLLLTPSKGQYASDQYNPVQDIISTIQAIIAFSFTKEAKDSFESILGLLFSQESSPASPVTDSPSIPLPERTSTSHAQLLHLFSFASPFVRHLERAKNRKDGDAFLSLIHKFNTAMRRLKKIRLGDKEVLRPLTDPTSHDMMSHILFQVYSRVVAPKVDTLKNYKAFSNEVYGEVKPNLVRQFIDIVGLQKDQVFIDMGSGIGNVVLQVAGETLCESYGVEILETTSDLAKQQMLEFKTRMKYYNLPYGKIGLYQGDFLIDDRVTAILKRADVIFVNNYVFDSSTNIKLLERFLDLEEGVKIISLKCFVSGIQATEVPEHPIASPHSNGYVSAIRRKPITIRTSESVESILDADVYEYGSQSVSWTDNGGLFYVHTINRAPLREFWKRHGMQ